MSINRLCTKTRKVFISKANLSYSKILYSNSREAKAKIELIQSKSAYGKSNILKPEKVELIAGKTYYWCSCGASKKQPYCDGTHKKINLNLKSEAEKFAPFILKCTETGHTFFCNCKASKKRPFCDGTHKA